MIYQKLLRPWLFRMDAETAHHTVFNQLKKLQNSDAFLQLVSEIAAVKSPSLQITTSGLTFPNPVGLAAGFDKNAELLPGLAASGFGFLEIGSITAQQSDGNPKPRMFRLPADEALINRMGLNNEGAAAICDRLKKRSINIPVGVNIAKTPGVHKNTDSSIQDYVTSFKLASETADYITLNISCPNTGDGKSFEDPELFRMLLENVLPHRAPGIPVFVKFSADTDDSQLEKLIKISEEHEVDGYVAVNTSTFRNGLNTAPELIERIGKGGLSGRPLRSTSESRVSFIRERIAPQKTLISVGGIASGEDALNRLESGANLVQLYTALVYEGPQLPGKINAFLKERYGRG
ncbi:MAG: quinone-dependent dihydroorotate dehydrogenase [Balneolia bacterium]|nr:quinone-dependent dihydroorotate dehydrogenase [Balneolia bacterium]